MKKFQSNGFECIAQMSESNIPCGYIGLPKGHKLYGKDYDRAHKIKNINVHGGLTYAEDHVPGCKPDGLWWLGFDMGHAGDLDDNSLGGILGEVGNIFDMITAQPGSLKSNKSLKDIKKELERLAAQL